MARYVSQGGLSAIPLLVLPGAASPTGPEPSALSSSSLSSLCCEVLFGKGGSCCLPKKDEQARGVSLYFTGETLELSVRGRGSLGFLYGHVTLGRTFHCGPGFPVDKVKGLNQRVSLSEVCVPGPPGPL